MTNEEINKIAFQIIAFAGDAKSSMLEAIDDLTLGKIEEADEKIKVGRRELIKAHQEHTKLLVEETNGNHIPFSMILNHACDHLTAAEVVENIVERMICLLKKDGK